MSSLDDYFASPPSGASTAGSPRPVPQQWAPPQSQQWIPQRPGQLPPTQLSPGVAAARRSAAPQPGFWRRWNHRRRIASMIVGAVVLTIRLATGDVFSHEPVDPRPVVLPELLGASSQTSDPTSVTSAADHLARTADWWPGRATGVAYYDSTDPAAAARSASYRGSSGAHVTAVRGRFHDVGDAYIFDQLQQVAGKRIKHSTADFGPDTCRWTSNDLPVTVCSRETDRLSISVMTLDATTAAEAAQLLDEAWTAVA